jgi:hypothetical protein
MRRWSGLLVQHVKIQFQCTAELKVLKGLKNDCYCFSPRPVVPFRTTAGETQQCPFWNINLSDNDARFNKNIEYSELLI